MLFGVTLLRLSDSHHDVDPFHHFQSGRLSHATIERVQTELQIRSQEGRSDGVISFEAWASV